jgi:hypothetical protein
MSDPPCCCCCTYAETGFVGGLCVQSVRYTTSPVVCGRARKQEKGVISKDDRNYDKHAGEPKFGMNKMIKHILYFYFQSGRSRIKLD